MGHEQNGAGVLGEKIFQPADGVDVEMIRRFVQQQHVRLARRAPWPAVSGGASRQTVHSPVDRKADRAGRRRVPLSARGSSRRPARAAAEGRRAWPVVHCLPALRPPSPPHGDSRRRAIPVRRGRKRSRRTPYDPRRSSPHPRGRRRRTHPVLASRHAERGPARSFRYPAASHRTRLSASWTCRCRSAR